jgi:hypothetical protein
MQMAKVFRQTSVKERLRSAAVVTAILTATLIPLMGAGTASASTAGSVATVENVTPMAVKRVCAQSLTIRNEPGGDKIGTLYNGEYVSTSTVSGAWVRVDPHTAGKPIGWVLKSYLC